MAQISYIKYSGIKEAHRYDAEFFEPFNLLAEKLITNSSFSYLENLGKFIIGPFGSTVKTEDYVEEKKYKYIRGKDVKNGVLVDVDNSAITKAKFDSLPRYHLKNNDVLITVVGTLGNVAIYRDSFGPAIFSCKSTVFRANKIDPEFLMIYLDTKYGKSLLMRNERGAIQKGFNLPDLKQIPVPTFSDGFNKTIDSLVSLSHHKQTQSKLLYHEAEKLLLKELGLLDYQIKQTLSFSTTKKEIDRAKRCDSEYFQPKYKNIIEKIEKYEGGFDTLENVIKFKDRNFTPKEDVKYKYLALSNISNQGYIRDYQEELGGDLPSRARRKINVGDVIISSIEGSLSSCAIVDKEFDNTLCSTGFFVLNSNKINPESLLILFKSNIIQELMQRGAKGTILTAISKTELEYIRIPLIKEIIQKQIAERIQESHKLRKESKDLLDVAKNKVEEEIEKNN